MRGTMQNLDRAAKRDRLARGTRSCFDSDRRKRKKLKRLILHVAYGTEAAETRAAVQRKCKELDFDAAGLYISARVVVGRLDRSYPRLGMHAAGLWFRLRRGCSGHSLRSIRSCN